jgi:hypothetical protein
MIIGQLVHGRMVFPGNIHKFVNPSDQPHSESFHVYKGTEEVGIAYSKKDAVKMCGMLKADSFERRPIFKQFPNVT